ncbi:hypothetical protein PC0014_02090 [Streptococcus pneumoniae]|nr:hypothetical protein SP670_0251 [Streptococcus pneumoniae 670-6B]EGI87086.1 hypothetical protein SPAR148_0157 [Streptococcus pneumoniae GA17545]EHE02697.1 hypothetical protein SPAR39_0187 [Streptococcus pneumoniae GA16242]EHE63085.1 hypothetical protein SPAR141_0157 [Streptococcus pneumoniae NP112]EJG95427.1 hypothetical protein SPAR151_0178 [Streptococcus pneumoniae GA04216]EOB18547.1 hypothetical protein D058_03391 [Streptococcus pneumoniae 2009]BDS64064.1 hypothetical protein PC0014_020
MVYSIKIKEQTRKLGEETLVNKDVLEAYLPWTKVVQEKCK